MGELAVCDEDRERYLKDGYQVVTAAMVDRLTDVVNDLEKNYHVDFKHWATPGHSLSSAALDRGPHHLPTSRTPRCCFSERADLCQSGSLRYLNRLSDVLWLFARFIETEGDTQGGIRMQDCRTKYASLPPSGKSPCGPVDPAA